MKIVFTVLFIFGFMFFAPASAQNNKTNLIEPKFAYEIMRDNRLTPSGPMLHDGPGPSHVVSLGSKLMVIDPWSSKITVFDPSLPDGKPVLCSLERSFEPWLVVRTKDGISILSERQIRLDLRGSRLTGAARVNPERGESARFISERMVRIRALDIAQLRDAKDCPSLASEPFVRAGNNALSVIRETGVGVSVSERNFSARRDRILPSGPRAQILTVRSIGSLSPGQSSYIVKEFIEPVWNSNVYMREFGPFGGIGRVTTRSRIELFEGAGRSSGRIEIRDFEPPLENAIGDAAVGGKFFKKRGFDSVAIGRTSQGKAYMAVITGQEVGQQFRVLIFDLDAARASQGRRIQLSLSLFGGKTSLALGQTQNKESTSQDQDVEREDPAQSVGFGLSAPPDNSTWESRAVKYVDLGWSMPPRLANYLCKDRVGLVSWACRVQLYTQDSNQLVSSDPTSLTDKTLPRLVDVEQNGDGNQPIWVAPRQHVGLTTFRGVPYSFGGRDTAEEFTVKLGDPTSQSVVGHLRGAWRKRISVGVGQEDNIKLTRYPLGIDCSAFVAAALGSSAVLETAVMMSSTKKLVGSNTRYFPIGRANSQSGKTCGEPVPSLSAIKPGDLIIRGGHIVIFAGTVPIGAEGSSRNSGSVGYRVYEAASRCGRVCESVYDADFFNGWWILRPVWTEAGQSTCPVWSNFERKYAKKSGEE